MPSPFQQKYSSQNHKVFGDNTTPAMPEAPKQEADRRSSESSVGSSSYDGRRRVCSSTLGPCPHFVIPTVPNISQSSAAQRFGNLEALKRRQDEESMARRQSFHDAYGKPGFIGTLWNKYVSFLFLGLDILLKPCSFTRGPISPSQK